MSYGLDGQEIGVQFPARASDFSLLLNIQTGSRAYPASYPAGTGASFLRDKVTGAYR
jgi:hypothetical protein